MSRARDFADLAGSADAGGLTGRNLIINGAMTVAQRGTSGTVSADQQYLSLDRWAARTYNGTGAFSVAQDTTVPSGQTFTNSLKATVTTTDTSGTYGYAIKQDLEGYTVNQLRTGTSDALKSTLSFWARSSVAGTYCCSVRGTAGAASYVFEYTLAANTWTKIEHTIAEPTTTTPSWNRTNGADYLLEWSLGSQTSKQTATTGSWHDGNYTATSNQTDWISNAGATFYLTGVQLEVGDTATPFEHEDYGTTLAKCQRYFVGYYSNTNYQDFATMTAYSTTASRGIFNMPCSMRTAPTLTASGAFQILGLGTATTISIVTPYVSSQVSVDTQGSGFTAGYAGMLRGNNDANAYIVFDAEL